MLKVGVLDFQNIGLFLCPELAMLVCEKVGSKLLNMSS
jgi:hypothetical protein